MAVVALVGLAHVEQLDRVVGEQALELVERDGLERSAPPPSCQPATSKSATACERAARRARLGLVARVEDERTLRQDERRLRREARAGDRNADGARHGGRPRTPPSGGRRGRSRRPAPRRSAASGGCAPRSGPRFSSTIRSMFGGRGGCGPSRVGEEVGELALERMVEAALEADRRRRLRAHRGAAERAGDVAGEDLDAVAELERGGAGCGTGPRRPPAPRPRDRAAPASPTKSESPVRTSHGSSPRERSITAKQQCSGRCPGVWIVRRTTVADLDLRPVVERLVREGRARVARGRGPGGRARARAGRGRRRGRRACASRARRRAGPRGARPPPGPARRVRRVDDDRDARVLVADEVARRSPDRRPGTA